LWRLALDQNFNQDLFNAVKREYGQYREHGKADLDLDVVRLFDVGLSEATDGHESYPRAIRKILGRKVIHRTSRYLNNRMEQDHRGLNSDTTRCEGLGASRGHHGFAWGSMSSGTISGTARSRKK
jgi:hypothetical protein